MDGEVDMGMGFRISLHASRVVLDHDCGYDYLLTTNTHPRRLARPQPAVAVVDLGPDADLAGDRVDFRADEHNLAVE